MTKVRDHSVSYSSKDIIDILKCIKNQPSTADALNHSNVVKNHKNILPDFDPSSKNQRVDIWLKKVNECASVYGWDDKTTIHFAMQKLQGLAKTWYESLDTILFTWTEWQEKLAHAFPFEQNYGQSLEDMLKRKSKYNEPIEVYYYEKLALLNLCDIVGKRAVDCIIHGLSDRTMKSSALALRCSHPEQLLQFLMSNKDSSNPLDRFNVLAKNRFGSTPVGNNSGVKYNNKNNNSGDITDPFCFNCKERGHVFRKCPKPLVRCNQCHRVGHKVEKCPAKAEDKNNKVANTQNTMCISLANSNSKFYKDVLVNGIPTKAFIDFGSDVCLLARSTSENLMLECGGVPNPIRGFGNNIVYSLGTVNVELIIDGVSAHTNCQVMEDKFLDVPLLVGQTYTEQSHVFVLKTAETLQFIDINSELPFNRTEIDNDRFVKIISIADLEIYGPAVVKAYTEPKLDGPVIIENKVIGRPMFQYFVFGGVYTSKSGFINIYIMPISGYCSLYRGTIISRASSVQAVNRIMNELNDPVTDPIEISKVRIGDDVNDADKAKLLKLLNKYRDCFATNLKELGSTNVTQMDIELNNKRPIVYRPYRLSHKERDQVRDMVGEMMEAGIIRESNSEYASPVILVRKKDGRMRMCIDYRMLNSVTVKEHYPMPVIEDEIARLSGQACFITLDLFSGYYQVPISEKSKPLTSFVTPDGQYEFNRMPFGLANAPAVFQRMMNKVLGSARYSQATAYIDDVLIYGNCVQQCLERLENVLQLLQRANLTLNLAKCDFLKDKIDYLGYEISALGVRPGDKKVQSVIDFPRPSNVHTVRQFLGLVGYFRKFVMNFAQLAHPLNKLLKRDAVWTWTDEQENSFKTLKEKLIDRPVLAIYDPNGETELHTDASKYGVGGILLQRVKGSSDSFRPVAFYSRQTSPEERNFHAYELETLAVVCSLRKFRVYLLGQNFKIITDCSALRSTFTKRDIIPRIARWYLLLQEFQCTIEYRPGNKMGHVDALSRNPILDDGDNFNTDIDVTDQCPKVLAISGDDWLHTLQLGDSELNRIRDILTSDLDVEGLKQIRDNYIIKDNKLYRVIDGDKEKLRWVVPKGARWQLCRLNHDDIGHFGVEKTLERIKSAYWFPKMSKFVKKYVEACIECAYSKKTSSNEGYLHTISKVEVPFHTVHIDHLGPFVRSKRGNCYILVLVDAFTKFTFIKPVRNTKSLVAIRVLDEIFCTFRVPDRIISDRGTCFTSHAFRRFCLDIGTKHVLNAVASPRSNGQVERYNRTILASLTAQNLNHNEKDWDDKLGKIQWGINNTVNKTTGKRASEIMFGNCMNSEVDPRLNVVRQEKGEDSLVKIREDVKDKIDEEQVKQKERYDKSRRPARVYSEGELVKISNTNFKNDGKSKKLLPQYTGPYRVISVLGNDRYRIVAIPGLSSSKHKRKTTVAADRMQPWVHVAALDLNDSDNDSEIEEHDE